MTAARTFRLTVAYDGSAFHGWQKQPDQRTVQGELERALAAVLGREELTVNGAGRTDTGVHARGQVASFVAETSLPASGILALARRLLPDDVRITAASEAPAAFHARHSARARRYAYRLADRDDVLVGRFAWAAGPVDGPALASATSVLLGEHDCSAFAAKGSSDVNPVCRVRRASWSRWEWGWRFDVEADHFLYHMVRNLVGSALRAQREHDPAAWMRAVLESRERSRAGATSPPHGLCLEAVTYDEEEKSS